MRPRFKLALGIMALAGALLVAGALFTREHRDRAAAPAATVMPSVPAPAEPLQVARPAAPAPVARTTAESASDEGDEGGEGLATVQGRVLDARTREPLPWFELDIESAGTPVERMTANAEGRFRSAGAFALTDLTLGHAERVAAPKSPFDARWQRFTSQPAGTFVESRSADGELEVLAEVGPTFHLALQEQAVGPAPGFPGFIVRLRTATSVDNRRRFVPEWSVATWLRHEGGTWARFAPIDERVAKYGPWRLSVESLDGLWYGDAPIESLASPQSVAIVLEALAHLTVAVLGPEGLHEPGVAVQLTLLEGAESAVRRWEWSSSAGARHALELLPAGDYLLRAGSLRHEAVEQSLRLAGGEDAEMELRVRRRPKSGAIAGELESATNTFVRHAPIAMIQLRRAGESRVLEAAAPTWVRSGDEWACTFRFEDLPPGEYEVSVQNLEGAHPWEPARARVVPPASELVFVRRDDLPTEDLELEVLDARGAPAENLFFQYTVEGGVEQSLIGTSPLAIRRVASGLEVEWAVSSPGFRPLRGNRAAFGFGDGNVRTLRRHLRPGWGARISTRSEQGPVAGVLVTIDGKPAGTTDADGILDVERDAVPRSFQAALSGWTCTVSKDKRALSSPRIDLVMVPERKL